MTHARERLRHNFYLNSFDNNADGNDGLTQRSREPLPRLYGKILSTNGRPWQLTPSSSYAIAERETSLSKHGMNFTTADSDELDSSSKKKASSQASQVAASHHVSKTSATPTNPSCNESRATSGRSSITFGSGDGSEMTVRRLSQQSTWANMTVRHSTNSRDANEIEKEKPTNAETTSTTNQNQRRLSPAGIKRRLSTTIQKDQHNVPFDYILNYQSTILEAISNPDRINALLACDDQVLTYDPRCWSWVVLQPRGRNLSMIAGPLLLLTLWYSMWVCLFTYVDGTHRIQEAIADLDGLISPLLVPVSFLLVFRLGRAAVRFWEARAAIGKIVEMCRVYISTAAIGCRRLHPEGNAILEDIARWVCVFPISVKNFLRPARRKGWEDKALQAKRRFELGQLVNDEEAETILNTSGESCCAPILVLNKLRELSWRVATYDDSRSSGDEGKNNAIYSPRVMLYQQLNSQLDTLTGAWGATERINGTPLPLVYVVHLRTFLLLYLVLWLLEASAVGGWAGLPIVLAACWGLLGIEAAAVECERPFQWHSNHLALGKMCVVATNNVAQTLQEVACHKTEKL